MHVTISVPTSCETVVSMDTISAQMNIAHRKYIRTFCDTKCEVTCECQVRTSVHAHVADCLGCVELGEVEEALHIAARSEWATRQERDEPEDEEPSNEYDDDGQLGSQSRRNVHAAHANSH
jgi:hypothetical protein